jgi:type I restriction enzyme S subunit
MSEGVPEGWKEYMLGRVCEVVGGGTPERHTAKYWNGDICWASPTEITALRTRYIADTKEKITKLGLENSSAKLHPVGTVLMTSRASIGFAAINTVPMATNQGFQSLRCKEQADNEFIYQWIIGNHPVLERLSSGSTFAEISSTNVRTVPVLLPPLPEQQKIASILTSVDAVIEKTEAQINKLQDLKKGMMQELLTKGIGHTEFKDSPVGRIPRVWGAAPMTAVSIKGSQNGPYKKKQFYGQGIEMVHMTEIFGNEIILSGGMQKVQLNHPKEDDYLLDEGDLLFARRSLVLEGAGKCSIVGKLSQPASFESSIIRIKPNITKIHPLFAYYYISSPLGRLQMMKFARQVAVSGITGSDLMEYKLPVPSIKEQKYIAYSIKTIDNNVSKKAQALNKVKNLKKALMQDLLTGKVRVKVD